MFMISVMKKLFGPITAAVAFLSLAPSAFAQIATCPLAPFSVLCFQSGSIGGIIGAAITFIFIVAVVIALFYLLFGAVRWIFSGGDKAAIDAARGTIVAAIVGLIILFLTFLLINVLLAFFNVNIGAINVPTIPTS
jgi:hypothetical protein